MCLRINAVFRIIEQNIAKADRKLFESFWVLKEIPEVLFFDLLKMYKKGSVGIG